MALTRRQKEKLKKLIKTKNLKEVAEILKIDQEEARQYLLKLWGKEKYQKRVKENKETQPALFPSFRFNLKIWFSQNQKYLIFLAILVLLVYAVSLPNEFLSDDIPAIVQNPQITSPNYFFGPQFFPFHFNPRNFFLFLIHKIFGLNPAPFRFLNIISHLGVVFLVYLLTHFFFPPPIPLFSASLYAVHPILTEAVIWISGGPYSNGAFFLLLSLVFWIVWQKNQKIWLYFSSLGSFFAALLFTERVIWFPAILLLYDLFFGNLKKTGKHLIPFFILVAWWTSYLLGLTGKRLTALETAYYQEPGLDNPLIKIPIAVTSYLELIFWPRKLTFYHSELNFTQTEYFLRIAIFIAFLGLILYLLKKERRLAFWLVFFLATLSPTLTPLRIAWVVAERYVYLGTAGILILVAFLVQKIGEKTNNQKISLIILGILITALSIRTVFRISDWRNQDTLWLTTAKYSPSSHQNHNNLGDMYARHGDYQKAIEEFQKAIALKPNYADAYHNLANIYHQINRDDLAEENYKKALEFNPSLWQSHQNLAALYFLHQNFDLAEQHLSKAIELNPQNAELYVNLGILYFKIGQKDKARQTFQKALTLDPLNQKAKEFLLMF